MSSSVASLHDLSAEHYRIIQQVSQRFRRSVPEWMEVEDLQQAMMIMLARYPYFIEYSLGMFHVVIKRLMWRYINEERRGNVKESSASGRFTHLAANPLSLDMMLEEDPMEEGRMLAMEHGLPEEVVAGREAATVLRQVLTEQEQQVLQELAAGVTTQQLQTQGISPKLVAQLQQKCQHACGVRWRAHAVDVQRRNERIKQLLAEGYSAAAVARVMRVNETTVRVIGGRALSWWAREKMRKQEQGDGARV